MEKERERSGDEDAPRQNSWDDQDARRRDCKGRQRGKEGQEGGIIQGHAMHDRASERRLSGPGWPGKGSNGPVHVTPGTRSAIGGSGGTAR